MIQRDRVVCVVASAVLAVLSSQRLAAHNGPPFPMVSRVVAGAYEISVWTDPDTTDDGSPGGQFWVILRAAGGASVLPADTRATITIRPLARTGSPHSRRAQLLDGDVSRQFVALLMDHEGPFAVHVALTGGLGPGAVDGQVDATYDLRPPPLMLALFAMPFVAVAFVWLKLLLRRRRVAGR